MRVFGCLLGSCVTKGGLLLSINWDHHLFFYLKKKDERRRNGGPHRSSLQSVAVRYVHTLPACWVCFWLPPHQSVGVDCPPALAQLDLMSLTHHHRHHFLSLLFSFWKSRKRHAVAHSHAHTRMVDSSIFVFGFCFSIVLNGNDVLNSIRE